MTIQVAPNARAVIQVSANNAPNAVAMPFPPLNPKNTGNMCPITAIRATNAKPKPSSPKIFANATGSAPFKISPKSTHAAVAFPPMRNILVAPGFFDPDVRGSGKPFKRHIIIALEMDPMR